MQIGGINSGLNSHGSSHHVTNCLHDHDVAKKAPGGLKISASSSASTVQTVSEPTAEFFPLADVLRKMLSTGRNLWGYIWGTNASASQGEAAAARGDVAADHEQVMAQVGAADFAERHSPHVAAASSAVQVPQMMVQNNPYFTAVSHTGADKEHILNRLRIRFRDVTGQMLKRFGGKLTGNLFGKSSFKNHRKQPKEDLRKHSRYREDGLELDCVLTDDSYLMDSYDRRGEYTQLTTKK